MRIISSGSRHPLLLLQRIATVTTISLVTVPNCVCVRERERGRERERDRERVSVCYARDPIRDRTTIN